MTAILQRIFALVLFFLNYALVSCDEHDLLLFDGSTSYQLAGQGRSPTIWVASSDTKAVQRTVADLALDFGRVFGTNGTVSSLVDVPSNASSASPIIIAGTIGQSVLIDDLVSKKKLDVSTVQKTWESYTQALVKNPIEGVSWALVVAGSDRRGTIYGLYDISEAIGVSPWYWWADVPAKKRDGVCIRDTQRNQKSPSVKYRGFFLNDEAPALTSWAAKRFGLTPSGRPFNSEFYKLIFELCLRLRANYIWPAMWGSAFYVDDAKNGPLAEEYGVVIGTSHHEPMARAEREQQNDVSGPWNWITNKESITKFFRGGVERSRNWETMYTMGMRGEGDAESPTLTPDALDDIIKVQQSILKDVLDKSDAAQIPQTWVLYKEVGRYYQAGMEVPDSVTLLWTDDNAGNLLRTPFTNETGREGGAGVYYHFDYVGSPRSYKWINTIQLVKTWEQMHLAYEKQAREIWIVNVGDLKALEVPMSHFLDMAYDMSKHQAPESTTQWIRRWAALEFGDGVADRTTEIFNTYGKLLIRRKYELLSRKPFVYSVAYYDEAERALKEWSDLLDIAQGAYDSLPQATRTSFFQMVLHPVLAGKTVVELYIKAEINAWRYKQRRTSSDQLANDVRSLFVQDEDIMKRYHTMNGGKWDQIMKQTHIGWTSWNEPATNTMPEVKYHRSDNVPKSGIMGVSVQGSNLSSPGDPDPTFLAMDPYMPPMEQRYIDISTRNNGSFSFEVKTNVSYVTLSASKGNLAAPQGPSDVRSIISVDWEKAPQGLSWVSLRVEGLNVTGGWPVVAKLPVNKTSVPANFAGYVESGGVVSIEAEHYATAQEKKGLSYAVIPHYGRTKSGVKLWPVTAASQTPGSSAPALTYSFHTFTSNTAAKVVILLGATLNHDPSRPLKYAFSIDGGKTVIVQPVPTTPMGSEPSGWTETVIAGGWTSTSQLDLSSGAHTLSLWLLETGVVVQKVIIDLGGMRASSLGPPESRKV